MDYKPRRLDVAALRAGNLVEVLNITAWSDVLVRLPNATLTGVQGWDELGSLLAQRYINNVTSSQAGLSGLSYRFIALSGRMCRKAFHCEEATIL